MTEKKFWTSEKLLSTLAIVISICTLGVFVYQTNLIRKQQYMSVYPHLSMGNYYSFQPNYQYVLDNSGIGPALIKSIKIKHKGITYHEDLASVFRKVLTKKDSIKYGYSSVVPGMLLPAKENILMIEAANMGSATKLYDILNSDDMEIVIEYESIYGERWRITNNHFIPIKIE